MKNNLHATERKNNTCGITTTNLQKKQIKHMQKKKTHADEKKTRLHMKTKPTCR